MLIQFLSQRMMRRSVIAGPETVIYIPIRVRNGTHAAEHCDLSKGHQPMFHEAAILLVSTRRIYNMASLRPGLEQAGHRLQIAFRYGSDSACLEEFGADCVQPISGGCLPSPSGTAAKRRLFGARERLGIKPRYITTTASLSTSLRD